MLKMKHRRSKREASKNASVKVNLLMEDEFYKTKLNKLKVAEVTDRQYLNSVSRKRESRNTQLEIFRSPKISPSRPIVVVPPIKRITSYGDFAQQKSAVHITKPLNMETKQITKVGKVAQPFAIRSSMDTYVINSTFPKLNSFAQQRKIAQVEPFKVFDEDQPLDLSVKKNKIVVENAKIPDTNFNKETEKHLKKYTHNEIYEKCEVNDLFTVNSKIERKVKNIKVIEKKKDEIVCNENDITDDKLLQRNTFVNEIHKGTVRHRKKMKPKISIRNGLKDDKNTFHTKIFGSISDDKRISDKNNNWEVLGKAYTQFVFISTEEKYQIRKCYPAIKRVSPDNIDDVTILKVNDCVIVKADNEDIPFVGKVSAIWMDEQNYIRLSLFWFYRQCQLPKQLKQKSRTLYDPFHPYHKVLKNSAANKTKCGKKQQLHCNLLRLSRRQELYLSLHSDCIYVSTIEDKCFVFSDYKQWLLKYGRAKAKTSQRNKTATYSVECNIRLKHTVEITNNEKEYNDINLFFYSKYFDAKTKSIKRLPPNHTDLSRKHLTYLKQL